MLYQQPQSGPIQIDWSNPLAKGLVRAYQFSQGGIDAVGNKGTKWTLNASNGATWGTGVAGVGLQHASFNGKASISDGTQNLITDELTVVMLYTNTATSTSFPDFLFGSAGSDYNWGFMFGTTAKFYFKNSGGSAALVDSGIALTNGTTRVYAATYASNAGSNNLKFYDSGLVTGVATHTGNASQISEPMSSQTWNGGNDSSGTIYLAYVFKRALSPAEIKSLSDSPWQLFLDEDEEESLLYVQAGGPQSLTVTPTGGISFSGAAPFIRGATKSASGGLTFGGSAAMARGTVRTATGGITFAGTAPQTRRAVRTPAGGVLLSGTAPVSFFNGTQSLTVTPAGGIVFSGTAPTVRSTRRSSTGGINFGGTSPYTNSGVILPTLVINRRRARPRVFPAR